MPYITEIRHTLQNIDWDEKFQNFHVDSMTDVFCNTLLTELNKHIPNKIFTFNDRIKVSSTLDDSGDQNCY